MVTKMQLSLGCAKSSAAYTISLLVSGLETERRMLRMWRRDAEQLDTVCDTWVFLDVSLSMYKVAQKSKRLWLVGIKSY